MTARLVSPMDAGRAVLRRLDDGWAAAVCDEATGGVAVLCDVPLSPGLRSGADVARIGFGACHDWQQAWDDVDRGESVAGLAVRRRSVTVAGVGWSLPQALHVATIDGAIEVLRRTGAGAPAVDLQRARLLAADLLACGADLGAVTLRAAMRLSDVDAAVAVSAVRWLADHPDLGEWTARQLPVQGMHSKWIEQHAALLRRLTGRDVQHELAPRVAVVHLTYVDPGHLAAGGRRHDAWTAGDVHGLAYQPRVVLVVENRDCRFRFPPVPGAVVVEGVGNAASALLADIPWIREADVVAYWGDIDAAGFAILDRFRAAMAGRGPDGGQPRDVRSILMDFATFERHREPSGVAHDPAGRPLPHTVTSLAWLTPDESAAYQSVATAGPATVRRIEQERLPISEAVAALSELDA